MEKNMHLDAVSSKTLLMKRLIRSAVPIVIAMLLSLSTDGRERQTWDSQPYKYEVRLGWGMPSDTPVPLFISNPIYSTDGTLSSIYSPKRGTLYSTGGISAEFGLNFRKWFTLAFQTSFSGVWNDILSSDGLEVTGKARGVVFNIAPQLRLNWVKRPIFRMYTSAGVGMTVVSCGARTSVESSFQFIPIGMAIGGDVFFFAEAGGGVENNFLGYHIGFGYRF